MHVPFKRNRSAWSISWNRVWDSRERNAGVITKWPSSKVRWRKPIFKENCHKISFSKRQGNFTSKIAGREPMRGWTEAKIWPSDANIDWRSELTSRWNEKGVIKVAIKQNTIKRQTKQTKKREKKETMGVLLSLCVYVRRSFPCEKQPDSIGYAHTGTCVTPRQLSNSLSPLIKVRVINLLFKFNKKKKKGLGNYFKPSKRLAHNISRVEKQKMARRRGIPNGQYLDMHNRGLLLGKLYL